MIEANKKRPSDVDIANFDTFSSKKYVTQNGRTRALILLPVAFLAMQLQEIPSYLKLLH